MLTIPDQSDFRHATGADLLSIDDLAAWLGDDLACRLRRHAHHVDYHGEPVIDTDHAADVIEMHRLEQEVHHG